MSKLRKKLKNEKAICVYAVVVFTKMLMGITCFTIAREVLLTITPWQRNVLNATECIMLKKQT